MSMLSELLKKLGADATEFRRDIQREFRSRYRDKLLEELVELVLGKVAAWIPAKWRVKFIIGLGEFIYECIFEKEKDDGGTVENSD